MSSTSPEPTDAERHEAEPAHTAAAGTPAYDASRRPGGRRRAIAIAAACLLALSAAGWWVWTYTIATRHRGSTIVIGEPGSPVPPGFPSGVGTVVQVQPSPAPPFSLTVLSSGAMPPASSAPPSAAGPPLALPSAGTQLTLSTLRGHPVVVNFWGSWCGPCRAEIPLLVKAWHAYGSRGVVVLGFDVDDTPGEARKFLEEYKVDYPIVTVADMRLPRAYGVVGLPTTVFVDASGRVRARQLGGFVGEDGARALTEQLDVLVAEHRP